MDIDAGAQITARELNQSSGRILDRVEAGETITVIRGGRTVAIIRRPGPVSAVAYPFRTDPMCDIDIPELDLPPLSDDEIEQTLLGMGGSLDD